MNEIKQKNKIEQVIHNELFAKCGIKCLVSLFIFSPLGLGTKLEELSVCLLFDGRRRKWRAARSAPNCHQLVQGKSLERICRGPSHIFTPVFSKAS
jgi:hypothetical protein